MTLTKAKFLKNCSSITVINPTMESITVIPKCDNTDHRSIKSRKSCKLTTNLKQLIDSIIPPSEIKTNGNKTIPTFVIPIIKFLKFSQIQFSINPTINNNPRSFLLWLPEHKILIDRTQNAKTAIEEQTKMRLTKITHRKNSMTLIKQIKKEIEQTADETNYLHKEQLRRMKEYCWSLERWVMRKIRQNDTEPFYLPGDSRIANEARSMD